MAAARQGVLGDDGNAQPQITPHDILANVASEFRVGRRKLKSKDRGTKRTCLARDELCRRLYEAGYTYYDIGNFLKRTHVGVMLAARRAEERLTKAIRAAS